MVLRTPNRAYACGLHAVPQADGAWYLGATAAPALHPGDAPTAGACASSSTRGSANCTTV
ncbi:hypothetical protein ACFQ7J_25865 [Streptomyces sp. NPDC056501]|uniref:hypothetical protein n=1 Tax=Streptomyces sp. NPDC056501 TaxID=3345841 RepID=UPI0036CB421A